MSPTLIGVPETFVIDPSFLIFIIGFVQGFVPHTLTKNYISGKFGKISSRLAYNLLFMDFALSTGMSFYAFFVILGALLPRKEVGAKMPHFTILEHPIGSLRVREHMNMLRISI